MLEKWSPLFDFDLINCWNSWAKNEPLLAWREDVRFVGWVPKVKLDEILGRGFNLYKAELEYKTTLVLQFLNLTCGQHLALS